MYQGEGIQHVALGSKDLYELIETLGGRGVRVHAGAERRLLREDRPAAAEARRAGGPA